MNTENTKRTNAGGNTIPFFIRKPNNDSVLDMGRVFDNDIEYMRDFLTDVYQIDWDRLMQTPAFKQLIALYAGTCLMRPFMQVLLNPFQIFASVEADMLYEELLKNKSLSEEERKDLIAKSEEFFDLDEILYIERPIIDYLVWEYGYLKKYNT